MLQNAPMYSYIPAKDVARARKFYEDTLGFKPKKSQLAALSMSSARALPASCIRHRMPAPRRRARRSGKWRT